MAAETKYRVTKGPYEGTGELAGKKVVEVERILPRGGAAFLMETQDRYNEAFNKIDALTIKRNRSIIMPWKWGSVRRLNREIKATEEEMRELRKGLP